MRTSDIERFVQILKTGGITILPVDTVYGLVAKAFDQRAFNSLDLIKGSRQIPYPIVFASLERFENWYGRLDIVRRRVISRLVPGPVSFIVRPNDNVPHGYGYHAEGVAIRVSSDPVLSTICRELGAPVWATSANRTGEPAPANFIDINPVLMNEVEAILDAGPTAFRQASTVIDLRKRPFRVLREGPWLERVLNALKDSDKPVKVLAVCSGNICRSPLAAALIRNTVGTAGDSRILVSSAGTTAVEGLPATKEMEDIAAEWGLDLSKHSARQITTEIAEDADLILTVSPAHSDYVCSLLQDDCGKVRLLGELIGKDLIPDPYQSSVTTYPYAADMIRRAVEKWKDLLLDQTIATSGDTGFRKNSEDLD